MTVQQVRDKTGKLIGTITTYPDTAEHRAELIRREGSKAAKALKIPRRQRSA